MRCSGSGLAEWPAEDLQALAMYMAKLNATYERDGFPRDEHAVATAARPEHAKDLRPPPGSLCRVR